MFNNEIRYPLPNQELFKPVDETTTTSTTTTTPPPTTTTTTTTTERTTTAAPVYQPSSSFNQYMPYNRIQPQIPTYFRNSQQLQQDFQAYMQYLAFTQMSQRNRGQLQFVPCMCPVTTVNGQQRPAYTNEFMENREYREETDSADELPEEHSENPKPKPSENNEEVLSLDQVEKEPIQENV